MIYGYLRVSSDKQDVESQKQGVVAFAQEKGWAIEEYITDEGVSGGKDPSKRNLGPLLEKVNKGDIIICSEISRLGRDLYMVMDILHFCMKQECVIYTVKDRFVLGDDIQSKVLAFAFGLAAEIERQMIRQRTKEGIMRRVYLGVLLGRPLGVQASESIAIKEEEKELFITQYKYGVPMRRLAQNFGVDRNTVDRWLHRLGLKKSKYVERLEKQEKENQELEMVYGNERAEGIDMELLTRLVEADLTIPEIHKQFPQYTYLQVYGTIANDKELNKLYRGHGQLKAKKKKI